MNSNGTTNSIRAATRPTASGNAPAAVASTAGVNSGDPAKFAQGGGASEYGAVYDPPDDYWLARNYTGNTIEDI